MIKDAIDKKAFYVSLARFKKHMPRSNDLTLIILKGHLLIEQEMNDIINSSLIYPKALLEARLTFSQRLALLKSLYGVTGVDYAYDIIEQLNILRNKLVHNLEINDLQKNIIKFVQDIEKLTNPESDIQNSKITLEKRLASSMAFLCGIMCGLREGLNSSIKNNG